MKILIFDILRNHLYESIFIISDITIMLFYLIIDYFLESKYQIVNEYTAELILKSNYSIGLFSFILFLTIIIMGVVLIAINFRNITFNENDGDEAGEIILLILMMIVLDAISIIVLFKSFILAAIIIFATLIISDVKLK